MIKSIKNKRPLINLGKVCIVIAGAMAGFVITGVVGIFFGAAIGGLFAHLLDKTIQKYPSVAQ